MINRNMIVEIIDNERCVKSKVPISELIEMIYQAVNEKLNHKTQEPKRGEK